MSILPRLTLCAVLAASMAGCVAPPPPQPRPVAAAPAPVDPRARFEQVQGRLAEESHRIDVRQQQGYIDPYRADGLRDRLRRIRQEAGDMASQHYGGLSGDEQRALNEELGGLSRDINR
ncbi:MULTISPECIES: hypothetical protein [Ralstonia solanacearum species complex]|uniref:hypothetical protein n=1 Tax=Ralstonia solanacearum species complex TaxID=3116862 RepID=UPI000E568221|nr:hypothetical protein [Ralstonia solanacearum]BEU71942.1 lipoprotein [Ralstonia pseudosolanacearum]AXV76855.1 hypothetical protein CJO76_07625 [Ralstonia solanacearum]AXV90869.1 hypothetical protein CJO79_07610 [Ralstonia solanacearum]AXW19025.1 hypothetical protein CJO85_07660 [Ralstonia solanacearum]AXW75781.1 hypothetical protein CJO97_07605 [Ralstonia solanacearum]